VAALHKVTQRNKTVELKRVSEANKIIINAKKAELKAMVVEAYKMVVVDVGGTCKVLWLSSKPGLI
jgi:hypothetical protein